MFFYGICIFTIWQHRFSFLLTIEFPSTEAFFWKKIEMNNWADPVAISKIQTRHAPRRPSKFISFFDRFPVNIHDQIATRKTKFDNVGTKIPKKNVTRPKFQREEINLDGLTGWPGGGGGVRRQVERLRGVPDDAAGVEPVALGGARQAAPDDAVARARHARRARGGVQRPPALRRRVHPRRHRRQRRRRRRRRAVVVVVPGARRGRRDVPQQCGRRRGERRRRGDGGVGADGGVAGVGGGGGEVVGAEAEEAAVEVHAAAGGREAERQLDAALRVAELAVGRREVAHALAEAVDGVGALTGGRGAEAGARDVLVDELKRVDEADVEALPVGRRGVPAHRGQYHRRGRGATGVVVGRRGDDDEEEAPERSGGGGQGAPALHGGSEKQ